jgi:hypothetical protein
MNGELRNSNEMPDSDFEQRRKMYRQVSDSISGNALLIMTCDVKAYSGLQEMLVNLCIYVDSHLK